MSERLNHLASLKVSQTYTEAWRKGTGKEASNYPDPESITKALKEVKNNILKQSEQGKIDPQELQACNKLYMGTYQFPNFPQEPSAKVIKRN